MAGQNARAPLQAFFDGCVDMEINGFEELDEAIVAAKLTAKGGSFKPSACSPRRRRSAWGVAATGRAGRCVAGAPAL
jgi:hypothetical protein